MLKRKPGYTDHSCRIKPEPLLLTENFETQLYYIASNDNLLKDLTMSFYNMETRNNHKKIVTENVGTRNTKPKKHKKPKDQMQSVYLNRNERRSHKPLAESKSTSWFRLQSPGLKLADTQSTLHSDVNRLVRKSLCTQTQSLIKKEKVNKSLRKRRDTQCK